MARRGVYLEERIKVGARAAEVEVLDAEQRQPQPAGPGGPPSFGRRPAFTWATCWVTPALERSAYDVIFCRNVLIYFDPPNQKRLIQTLLSHLKPEGLLFLGHSETMLSLDLAMRPVAHAVYKKT